MASHDKDSLLTQHLSWVNIPLHLVVAPGTQVTTKKKEMEEAPWPLTALVPPWAPVLLPRLQWPQLKHKRDPEMWRSSFVNTVVPAAALPLCLCKPSVPAHQGADSLETVQILALPLANWWPQATYQPAF